MDKKFIVVASFVTGFLIGAGVGAMALKYKEELEAEAEADYEEDEEEKDHHEEPVVRPVQKGVVRETMIPDDILSDKEEEESESSDDERVDYVNIGKNVDKIMETEGYKEVAQMAEEMDKEAEEARHKEILRQHKDNPIEVISNEEYFNEYDLKEYNYDHEDLYYFLEDDKLTNSNFEEIDEAGYVGERPRKFGFFNNNGQDSIKIRNHILQKEFDLQKIDTPYDVYTGSAQ